MKGKYWLILFSITLAADLFVSVQYETLRYLTKPLLMPLLIGLFIFRTAGSISSLKKWVVLALSFSWAGDVLLMFEPTNGSFFIFGLIAFLVAHIFYILFFDFVIRMENLKKKFWLYVPVLVYYVVLIYILTPTLDEMKLPVRIYGVVISYMLIQSLQTSWIRNRTAALLMILGAILFITSDSVLAINKFYNSFEYAGIIIMLTYGLAQLLITLGAVRYITSTSKQ